MDCSNILAVSLFVALVCSSDAVLTWNSPVTVTGGQATYTVSITEGATTFTPALTITAVTNVTNAEVKYGTVYVIGQDSFDIDIAPDTGTITLSEGLDFETVETYILKVVATEDFPGDNQTGAASTTATVTINVEDVPTFANTEDSVCIPDGATAGYEVTTFDIADKWNVDNATYSISGDGDDKFDENDEKIVVAAGQTITKGDGDPYTLVIKDTNAAGTLNLAVTVGDCSAASLHVPLVLLTLLMALVVSMH